MVGFIPSLLQEPKMSRPIGGRLWEWVSDME